ncbi:hypothetical protein OQA88_2706 [Cercophora sp. LCS_1]
MSVFRLASRLRPAKALARSFTTSGGPRRPSSLPLVFGVGATTSFALGWYSSLVLKNDDGKAASAASAKPFAPSPKLDTTTGHPFVSSQPLSPEDVTATLNGNTWSVIPGTASEGITRCDGSQVASNNPCEDRYIYGRFPSPFKPSQEWQAFGVFDGHLGSETAQALTKHLIPYVHRALQSTAGNQEDDSAIHSAISTAFLSLDNAFVSQAQAAMDDPSLSWAEKLRRISTGANGSCALLSLYDPSSRKLHIACTGDSRAVMGRQNPTTGAWELVPLSVDQGGGNPTEKERITAEHPGEDIDKLVKGDRVLGLATARAFGDGHWKWPLDVISRAKREFNYDTLRPHDKEVYRTPPYITAKPEVTTTVIEKDQKAFMIMASDGLWDSLSSKEAAQLVGQWLEWQAKGQPAPKKSDPDEFGKFDWTVQENNKWRTGEEKFTVCDKNAAVHLTRNALGGRHHDMISGILSFRAPFSRYARDDITVQVVFFNV